MIDPAVQAPRNDWGDVQITSSGIPLFSSSLQHFPTENTTLQRTNNQKRFHPNNRNHGRPICRVQEGHRGQPQPLEDTQQRRASRGKNIQEARNTALCIADGVILYTDLRPLQAGQR